MESGNDGSLFQRDEIIGEGLAGGGAGTGKARVAQSADTGQTFGIGQRARKKMPD